MAWLLAASAMSASASFSEGTGRTLVGIAAGPAVGIAASPVVGIAAGPVAVTGVVIVIGPLAGFGTGPPVGIAAGVGSGANDGMAEATRAATGAAAEATRSARSLDRMAAAAGGSGANELVETIASAWGATQPRVASALGAGVCGVENAEVYVATASRPLWYTPIDGPRFAE